MLERTPHNPETTPLFRMTHRCEGINKDGTQCTHDTGTAYHLVDTTPTCRKHWTDTARHLDRLELIDREITRTMSERAAQFPKGFSESVEAMRRKYKPETITPHQTPAEYIANGGKIATLSGGGGKERETRYCLTAKQVADLSKIDLCFTTEEPTDGND